MTKILASADQEKVVNPNNLVASRIMGWQEDFDQVSRTSRLWDQLWMILAILGLTLFNFGAILAIFGQKVCIKTISTYLKLLLEPFFVMESTFSIEKFLCFAMSFR